MPTILMSMDSLAVGAIGALLPALSMDVLSVGAIPAASLALDDVAVASLGLLPVLEMDDIAIAQLPGELVPRLEMDNVQVAQLGTPTQQSMVFLDWSNDRGHSFGNPVGQPLGEKGEYLTSIQWARLGYARDRVFRLTWSTAVGTALQGAWVEVDTSAKS